MDIRSDKPLLTIAIPTFNRSGWLDVCLSQIVMQATFGGQVEIFVSNNNSTDNTDDIVNRYVSSGLLYRI